MTTRPPVDFSRLDGHDRAFLQFSGGKDSLALVYLFKEHLHRLTVLHCDAGDLLPEIQELVAGVARQVPNFLTVKTDAPAWIAANGLPSDLVPIRCHPAVANVFRADTHPVVPLTDCCAANRWQPMRRALVERVASLVIHGQRRSDLFGWDKKQASDSAQSPDGWQVWAPIAEWSDDDVMAYLREVGAPILRWYSHKPHAPECATCPASWGEGRAASITYQGVDISVRPE